jgi:hypothetical protein
VQQAGEFLALGLPPLHSRLKQRFLNLARHVAPTSSAARSSRPAKRSSPSEISISRVNP